MTWIAATCLAALVIQTVAYGGLLMKLQRRYDRRVDTLLDRLAHAQGRTWTPPPADNGQGDDDEQAFVLDPFQQPD